MEHCIRHGITPQAYMALSRGLYSDAPPAAPSAAEESTAALVAGMAAEKKTPGEAVLLGWLMKHPAGIAPVIGTAKPKRIRACAADVAAAMTF
ncbi:putative oxidoreductase [Arthrobacter sp. UYEF3]